MPGGQDGPTQPHGDEAAPENDALPRAPVGDLDGSPLPDWRDAHLPRYEGGTHMRIGQSLGEVPAGLVLRSLSVVPFVVVGLVAFLAAVSLLAIVLLGGGGGQSLASWVRGRSGGQIAAGILQLLGLELACAAVIVISWRALRYGFRAEARAWFWLVSAAIGGAGAVSLFVVRLADPSVVDSISLGGHDWLVLLALFGLMATTSVLRLRQGRPAGREPGA